MCFGNAAGQAAAALMTMIILNDELRFTEHDTAGLYCCLDAGQVWLTGLWFAV